MNNFDICMKESDLKICFGDLYMPNEEMKPRELAYSSVKYLYSDLTDIRKYYIRLGFHLEEFSRCGYYRDFGFVSLEEFCEVNLGLDKSSVSRCINVYRAFNASNSVSYKNGVKSVGAAIELSDEWKDYSYTQLCEMLPLSPEQRKDITSDMSISQIREYKKNLKAQKPVASTQPNPFDVKLYDNSQGIVKQNAVRNCIPINDDVTLTVFDKDGKFVYGDIVCSLIYAKDGRYYFRLWQSDNTKNKDKE
ncbi:MAG: hypothetical protein K2P23_10910 [Lachnospiraceae bacterium]|nr:hypothetical protein [Lachnospiraceae bacterium]